jgi:hypothetical protein
MTKNDTAGAPITPAILCMENIHMLNEALAHMIQLRDRHPNFGICKIVGPVAAALPSEQFQLRLLRLALEEPIPLGKMSATVSPELAVADFNILCCVLDLEGSRHTLAGCRCATTHGLHAVHLLETASGADTCLELEP